MRHFASMDMRVLDNQYAGPTRGGDALVLAGVADLPARNRSTQRPTLTRRSPGSCRAPVLLLDHEPKNARAAAACGAALQLSGHTHGGMILGLDQLFALPTAVSCPNAMRLET